MGWTHDYRDVARDRRSSAAATGTPERGASDLVSGGSPDLAHPLGIPRILRRRARWMTARLKHPRT
ncbi:MULTISPECIES: hypothetical protein [Streptomyces]|uniref:Uncharacterized protein n=1 Tax=Streptomyces rimosus subsp. rimosus (strain ATCC 10970 / DSM 40260 / JCM 4667 / NRRL 2234) TaxID=1265868 RepID=A0A8A1UQR7_STRR1|nr:MULTISPECIES: hypothetical protein [Streptomyces]MYT43473.1 hypothetical protein [Streptomyces sp. SID5471]KAA6214873.1 hypothetical protein CP973_38275 [Streptomyces albofaciens JCM 4342]QDA05334.1 hypothetical protein CTZ40_17765 [Streptomyces rimosus]QEV76614.1 hypothetical protein CP984_17750 [Streptomyces rimosus]QGY65719.1 hypothetical protein V519_007260 [Streptomyces rimosus R6-500]